VGVRGGLTGIAYISYIPPKMKANKLRTLLTKHGAEILRVYLAPEDSMSALRRKKSGGKRGKRFTEGCVCLSAFACGPSGTRNLTAATARLKAPAAATGTVRPPTSSTAVSSSGLLLSGLRGEKELFAPLRGRVCPGGLSLRTSKWPSGSRAA
jgi:hypothetical protein